MAHELSIEQVNSYLLRKQHLTEDTPEGDIVDIVRDAGGLHATGAGAPYLSLWARSATFAKGDLQRALYEKRSLGKVLCMRDTLFILPKELLHVAYQATTKRLENVIARYLRGSGLSKEEYEHWMALILRALASGPKTSAEIVCEIGEHHGLKVTLAVAPNDWRLIRARPRGTWRSNQHEYAVFADWFPDVDLNSIRPEEARAHLVRYYLGAFGPAKEEDITWWAGFNKGETSAALKTLGKELMTVHISHLDGDFLVLATEIGRLERTRPGGYPPFMLPSLDPLMMGHKDRRRFLSEEDYRKVFDPAGNALPTIWLDGQVVGVWQEKRSRASLILLLLQEVGTHNQRAIEAEGKRLGEFLGHKVAQIEIAPYPPGAYPKSPFTIVKGEEVMND